MGEGAVEGDVDDDGGQQGAKGEKTVQGGPIVVKIDEGPPKFY